MQTYISELNKLRNVEKNLESACGTLKERITAQVDSTIVQLQKKLQMERENACTGIQRQIMGTLSSLCKIKTSLENDANGLNLAHLKNDMIVLQHNIATCRFNVQAQLACLSDQEKVLSEEIGACEAKIVERLFENSFRTSKRTISRTSKIDESHSSGINKEKLEEGCTKRTEEGHFIWSREDHLKFLKARKTLGDFDRMCKVLMELIKDISLNDIAEHEHWYIEQSTECRPDILDEEMNIRKGTSGEGSRSSKQRTKITRNEKAIKEKLAAWKEEKKDKAIMEQHLRQLLEIKRMNEELYRRLKNEEAKEKIQKWKQEKTLVASIMKQKQIDDEKAEKEAKTLRANCMIKEYRKQDVTSTKKKQRCKSEPNAIKPFETVQIFARSDPARLSKPTEQWSSRTKGRKVPDEKPICNMNFINKLLVPAWRRSS